LQTRTHLKGVIYASLAGIFWGMAGIASEYLFQDQHVSVYWMMGVKMSLSALTLLGLAYYLDGKKIFLVFKSFKDILGIVLFSILGLENKTIPKISLKLLKTRKISRIFWELSYSPF